MNDRDSFRRDNYKLIGLNSEILDQIFLWRCENPYNIYDLYLNDYLKNSCSWGLEQFALAENDNIISYVSCQIIQEDMWVGWSLRPYLCGNRIGQGLVRKCINELILLKNIIEKIYF